MSGMLPSGLGLAGGASTPLPTGVDPEYGSLGLRIQQRQENRRLAFGETVLRTSDNTTYLCAVKVLTPEDVDRLQLESGVNAKDQNAIVLRMPLTCPMKVGDFILYPATGTANADRYRVVSLPPAPQVQGITGKSLAVCFWDPDRS